MYTIQIVGAGYVGTQIAKHFIQKKQKVFALTRSKEKAEQFEGMGIQPIVADLTQTQTLKNIPPANFIVICPAPDESTAESYSKIYLEGVKNYIEAIGNNPRPSFVVYISSTGVWRDQVGDVFDENTKPEPTSEKAKILLQAEQQILAAPFPSSVLRLSGIYGPKRNRLKAFKEGKWPQGLNRWMNVIHVEDIACAMPIFFKNAKDKEVYVGTDNQPFLSSELAQFLSESLHLEFQRDFEYQESGRRLSNQKFKLLGIRLKYPTYREGYSEIIKKEEK